MDEALLSGERFEKLKRALEDRYSMERELGVGGMGIVFLAHDRRHDRKVAIKVLLPELAASVGTARFLREIRIEAQLNHPHILPVYDSGEAEGLLFCVMPFFEGESLKERLRSEGQLPCNEALRITREIADALSYAHANGFVHRDVKPANILLDAGHAVLGDFGIARILNAVGDETLTRTGFSVGTPAYSSPEQTLGENTDGRSDLYSLGCVLYEMLVGQPPFVGPSADSVVRQHLTTDPISVKVMRPAVPEAMAEFLEKLLAKSPADRYSTAEELIRDIDRAISGEWPERRRVSHRRQGAWWKVVLPASAVVVAAIIALPPLLRGGGSPPAVAVDGLDPRAVAVLYFDDLSPGGDLQHVADGLTEGLIGELTRVRDLDIVSRNGVAGFRGSLAPLDSIARALEVGTLIRGALELVGERLRVSVRLVEGGSGVDFERSIFEVPSTEILLARDSVVQEVAWLLRQRLGEEIRLRTRRAATTSVDAWVLAQRGERERKMAEERVAEAQLELGFEAFQRADSLFALAHAVDPRWSEPPVQQGWIAYRRSRLAWDMDSALSGIRDGFAFAEEALAVDPNDPSALELRGTVRYWHWLLGVTPGRDEAARLLREAQEDLEAAVRIDPSLASAHSTLSHLYYQVSDLTNALVSARRAYEADAFLSAAPEVLWRLFLASYDTESFTQARSWCGEGHRRFPGDYRFWECRILEMTLPSGTPDVEEAWRLHERTVELTPEGRRAYQRHRTMIWVAEVLSHANLPDSARGILLQARAGADVDPNLELPFLEAHVRSVLGDHDEAVRLLRTYFAAVGGAGDDSGDWATHWWWRPLRSHSGFQDLLQATR